jgi:hypothetical protein
VQPLSEVRNRIFNSYQAGLKYSLIKGVIQAIQHYLRFASIGSQNLGAKVMDSFDKSSSRSDSQPVDFVNPELLLGLATVPMLAGLVVGKALLGALREVGTMSEEIFRGDRLPLLNFPVSSDSNPDNPESV